MAAPRIKTTVVGSYPVPDWLAASPSEQALVDAMRVVIATQEQAGIDVVCDGELYRFDVNHPETNGMIEYFVRARQGARNAAAQVHRHRPAYARQDPAQQALQGHARARARHRRRARRAG